MKKTFTFLFLLGGLLSSAKESQPANGVQKTAPPVSFTENKGQVRDLNSLPRTDV